MTAWREEWDNPQAAALGALPYDTFSDLAAATIAKQWIFKGVMARGETSAWIAPPGGMKSALMAEASICAAAGIDWRGKRLKERGAVAYFALERADLVRRRLIAHGQQMGLIDLPIAVIAKTIDLMSAKTVPALVATVDAISIQFKLPVRLIIFDTFAKLIAAGGGDENQAKDQGAVFANIQRLKERVSAHVALVGHTGKDETRGARGSNAILGDADVMVRISGDSVRTATIEKANDLPEGPLFSFTSELHDFGKDEDGDPITVNILSNAVISTIKAPAERRLTDKQRLALEALDEAVLEDGQPLPSNWGLPSGLVGTTNDSWREQLLSRRVVDPDSKNPWGRVGELRIALHARKLIGVRDELVWRATTTTTTSPL